MKTLHFFAASTAAALLLCACDGLGKSAEERINAALPIGTELIAAKANLDAIAKDQTLAPAIQREFDARLKMRALECGHGYEPSAMASDESIRDALTDKDCFAAADRKLGEWLAQRSIGVLLAAPPLRPLPKDPPKLIPAPDSISDVAFAERAGVALLQSRKSYQFIDLNNGQAIRGAGEGGSPGMSLSPNGRLFVTRREGHAEVRSTEGDKLLASYEDVQPYQFHWVGDVGAVFSMRREKETGKQAVFVDFTTGAESVLPFGGYEINGVLAMPGKAGHYVLLGNDRIGEMSIEQAGGARKATLLSEMRLGSRGMWSRNSAGLSADGKMYYGARESLQLIELDSLRMRNIPFLPMRVSGAVATPDPDLLLLTGIFSHSTRGYESFLYSISKRTFAPVDREQLLGTRIIYIPSLRRNAVIEREKIVFIDALPAGEPVAVEGFLAQREAEGNAYAAANPGMYNGLGFRNFSAPAAASTPNLSLARMLVKSEREGGTSPDFIAAARKSRNIDDATWAEAKRQLDAESGQLAAAATAATAKTYPGPVAELGKKADVEAIGIYEAQNQTNRVGNVQVRVRRSSRPVILSLSSYEKVRWVITLEAGAKLAAVLCSGYNQSEVFGGGDARVYQIGRHYAYQRGSDEYSRLDAEVARWTGKQIGVFQGGYKGDTYFVGR